MFAPKEYVAVMMAGLGVCAIKGLVIRDAMTMDNARTELAFVRRVGMGNIALCVSYIILSYTLLPTL